MSDDDQLMIEIGGRTDNFAASLVKVAAKASSAMSLIEARGQGAADKLTSSFSKVGGTSFTLLNKALTGTEGNAAKLGARLETIKKVADSIKGTALDKLAMGQAGLVAKLEEAGGLSSLASSIAGGATSALVAGGAAFLGFEAFKFSLNEVIKASDEAEKELSRLVKIGSDANSVGVGSTFFQEFTQGSKKLGLEAADLTTILTKLKDVSTQSLGTGDDLNPKSSAQDAIAAHIQAGNLNKGDAGAFDAAKSQQDRLRVSLAMLSELQAKGAQLASFDLADKLFGSDFAGKLREDDGLIGKLQARLSDMASGKGANVIPPEQIAAAKELDAELQSLNDRVINALTPFHNDVRTWQQDELRSTLELKEYWVEIVEVFGNLWSWADRVGKTINGWGNAQVFKDLVTNLDKMGLLDKSMLDPSPKSAAADPADGPPLTVTKKKTDTSKPLPEKAAKAPHEAEKTDPVQTYVDELTKATAAEKAEADTLGLSNKAKLEAIDLAKAKAIAEREDRTLTADETRDVLAQADAYSAAKDKIEAFNKKQEQAKELAQYVGNEFETSVEKLVTGSGKLADVLKSVVTALEQAALKALLLGEGPLAGLFGTAAPATATGAASVGGLFGSFAKLAGFATGGEIAGLGTGTSDSIMARLSDGEFVVNAKSAQANLGLLHAINGTGALPRFATGGQVGATSAPSFSSTGTPASGSPISIENSVTVNANGGTSAQNADLAAQTAKHVEATMRGVVASELRRQMRPGNTLSS